MRKVAPVALSLLTLAVILPLAGCQKMRARIEMKKGNEAYSKENYREAIKQYQDGLALDPTATFVHRSVGLAAMAMFRPDLDTPENKKYGQLAIESFQKYLQSYPTDEKVKDYMMTTFMNAGQYEDALRYLKADAASKPTDVKVDGAIVTVLIRQDKLQDAYNWARAHASKSDPAVFYSIGVTAWDKAYQARKAGDTDLVVRQQWIDFGKQVLAEAVRLKPDYHEAMVYQGLLIREQIELEPDLVKKQEMLAQAEEIRKKALELRQKAELEAAKQAAQQAKAAGT